ncbi:hypothetical protein ABFA25_09640 [Mycobacterium lepromatosis]
MLGLSYTEAGGVCGCPVSAIRSRVARARDNPLPAINREAYAELA